MTENQLTPTDPLGLARAERERIDRDRERQRLANEKQANDEKFRTELEHLLNKYSRENNSNTPDFILADFLADCLDAWDAAVQRRNRWYTPDERQQPFNIEGGEDDG